MGVELETKRLKLRQFREADTDPLLSFYRDSVSESVYGPAMAHPDVWKRIAAILGHWQLRGYGRWAIEEKSSGTFAGYCGLSFTPEFADIEVGYGIMPAYRGKGIATEAARCARDYGYRQVGATRIVSYINPVNASSIHVAEKLQAQPDGTFMLSNILHTVYLHQKS